VKLVRPTLTVAVGAAVVLAMPAGAVSKPKPVCNLVTDDKGDSEGLVSSGTAGLDILTADVASDAKKVTAVMRLAGSPMGALDPDAPEGAAYYVSFTVPGAANPVYLSAQSDVSGAYSYSIGDIEPSPTGGQLYQNKAGDVKGTISGNNITMSVDRATLAALGDVKPGKKLGGLAAEVFYPVEVPMVGGLLEQADTAESKKAYVAGAPSCVKPGA
jgi:hypothetical protein